MASYKMGDLIPLIQAEATKQGIDPALAVAHFIAENTSNGVLDPNRTVSTTTQGITPGTGKPSGALGLFQVVPTTLRGLIKTGKLPENFDYTTVQGQIQAGVTAVGESQQVAQNRLGKPDVLAGAAQYSDGTAGFNGYLGVGRMPEQAKGYIKKIATALGISMDTPDDTNQVGNAQRYPSSIPTPTGPASAAGAPSTGRSTYGDTGLDDAAANFQEAMGTVTAARKTNMPLLQAMMGESAAASEGMKSGLDKTAQANIDLAASAAARDTAQVQRDTNLLALFGMNPTKQDSQLVDLLAKQASANQAATAIKPDIDTLMAVNPLANPVRWVAAQFQLGAMVPQYNAAVQNASRATEMIATQQKLIKAQAEITPSVTVDNIAEEMRAKASLALANAQFNKNKIDVESINQRARFVNDQLVYAQGDANIAGTNLRLQLELMGIKKDQAAAAAEQKTLDRVNKVRLVNGAPPIASVKELNNLPKDQREALVNANPQASSPGEGIYNLLSFGDVHALQGQLGNQAFADQAAAIIKATDPEVEAKMRATPGAKLDDVRKSVINKRYALWRDEALTGDATKMSPDNPYRINAIQAASAPTLINNTIAKQVLANKDTMPDMKEKDILSIGLAQIKAGASPDQVAADTAEFYRNGYHHQFTARGLGTLGFDARTYNKQVYYGVKSNVFGFIDRFFGAPSVDRPIDLMNPTSLKQFYTEVQIKQMQQTQGRENPGFMGGGPLGLGNRPELFPKD